MSTTLVDRGAQEPARIGPNAVTQTLHALTRREGEATAHRVAEQAELPSFEPRRLVPEAWFVSLIEAVRATLTASEAEAVLADSGARTAAYVATHRIPAAMRWLLPRLPARLAIPTLLRAFAAHAWTFAGAGTFAVEGPYPGTIVLRNAPTCRASALERRGAYYAAAFQGLLASAVPGVRVEEVACQAIGDDACRFLITLESETN